MLQLLKLIRIQHLIRDCGRPQTPAGGETRYKPLWLCLAGRVAGTFGVHFFRLCYGERRLADKIGDLQPSVPVEIRRVEGHDLSAIAKGMDRPVRKRFEQNRSIGSTCYAALLDNRVVGFLWLNSSVLELMGMRLGELPPATVLVHHAHVFPAYRGMKVLQALLHAVYRDTADAGKASAVCLVDRLNGFALAAFERTGFQFRKISVLKLPGCKPVVFGSAWVRK